MKQLLRSVLIWLAFVGSAVAQPIESYVLNLPPGLSLIANQLDQGGNTLNEVMPVVPDGSKLYFYDPQTTSFGLSATYSSVTGSWAPDNLVLPPGKGAFFENKSGAPFALTFTGTRRLFPNTFPELSVMGSHIVSFSTPQAGDVNSLGFPVPCGPLVLYKFNGFAYELYIYDIDAGGWSPAVPVMAVGEAFIIDVTVPCAGGGDPFALSCPAAKTVPCGTDWTFDLPIPQNACDGPSPVVTVVSTVTNGTCPLQITRTYEATDACDNRASCSQTITVTDTTPPQLTCAPDKTVECGVAWDFDPPIATDSCSDATINVLSTLTNGTCPIRITRTYEAADACGNRANCSQTVLIADTTPPQVVCPPDKTVECGVAWDFDPPTATDSCSDATINVLSTLTNGTCPVRITRTYEAVDACGNRATCSQTVLITDTTAPRIACAADKTVECGAGWDFDPPTATDSCGTVTINVLNTITNGACPGTIVRTWEIVDQCGNRVTCQQTVKVQEPAKGDLYVEDTPYNYNGAPDLGREPDPNMTGQPMWMSRSIWVHQDYTQPLGTFQTHQNPRYGQTNCIMVNVGNRGGAIVNNAQLKVYVANASLGLAWPSGWTLIGTYTLPAIDPGAYHIAQVLWVPQGPGHYCLLARIVSDEDPMAVAENASISANVRANNNLAWRNVNVVNLLTSTGHSSQVRMKPVHGHVQPAQAPGEARHPGEKAPRQPLTVVCRTEAIFHEGEGQAILNLGPWFKRWQEAGGRGQGITVVGDTSVRITNTLARLEDIPMDEDEEAIINLVVLGPHPLPIAETHHVCHVELAEEINGEEVGGVSYGVTMRALHTDTDHDGIPDIEDPDDDGDGVPDVDDEYPLGEPDCPPAALTIRYVDGNMVLSWDGLSYRLQTSSVINRAWHQIHGATSPFIVPPTEAQQFFRLICH
ncbi:MAG TPA: HYR domain-containing protein [Verrucomicrobiae bacterium]|nr:HYR domain-containing protein [Verrucomicrobiae bacterium]